VRIAREVHASIHVLHVSTSEEMRFLADHKDVASVEVTPHHLTFTSDDYKTLGTLIQMNPPVRDARHKAAIWHGISTGVVDVLGSDHAPHTREEKDHAYPGSHSGMTGVQTLVPTMLDHVNAGRLSLERFVDLTSAGPQRLFGLAGKGRIAVGYDADLVVLVDPAGECVLGERVFSRCGWTPYAGTPVRGRVERVVLRGQEVYKEGIVLATPGFGKNVRIAEC